jgi:hypothetical protein
MSIFLPFITSFMRLENILKGEDMVAFILIIKAQRDEKINPGSHRQLLEQP